jgi:hypothetical protein
VYTGNNKEMRGGYPSGRGESVADLAGAPFALRPPAG